MVRLLSSSIAAVAVVLLSSSSVLAENSGVCGEQARCIQPSISSCIGGKRQICVLFRPGYNGCNKGWSYAFPDVCAVTDESAGTAVVSWPFDRRWAGRVCHSIRPADGSSVTFSIRDDIACSGGATDFSYFSTKQLAGVARCSPATHEMCDNSHYTSAYFDKNPAFSTSKPKACKWTINAGKCGGGTMCCMSMDVSCLACRAGFSTQDFCAAYPDTDGCPPLKDVKICCDAVEASCEACKTGQSVEEYCSINPSMDGCPKVCCMALEASCEACKASQSIEEYCAINPSMDGCPKKKNNMCCMAMEASCEACKANQSIDEYCAINPSMDGCPKKKKNICCMAMEASCEACKANQSIDEYCAVNPSMDGCPEKKMCCMAMEASCEACKANQSIDEYCAVNPSMDGCPN